MDRYIKYFNILALAGVIIINYLANSLPINGQTTADVSANYPVLFTPEGYVFAIWGLIYLLLVGFVIYQALPRQGDKPILLSIGYLFILSSILNIFWLFAWHYNLIVISLIIMLALLFTLIALYLRINIKNDLCFSICLGFCRY